MAYIQRYIGKVMAIYLDFVLSHANKDYEAHKRVQENTIEIVKERKFIT